VPAPYRPWLSKAFPAGGPEPAPVLLEAPLHRHVVAQLLPAEARGIAGQAFCSWGVPMWPCAKLTELSVASKNAIKTSFRIFSPLASHRALPIF
jgi:hypothetical protein